MDSKIKKLLEQNKIKHKLIEHKKVYTAFTEAETMGSDPKAVVKTVFVKFSKPAAFALGNGKVAMADAALAAVPAKKRVDFKKIAKSINDHQQKSYKILLKSDPKQKKPSNITVKMASEKDIKKRLETKVGLLSAFSQIYGLPLLFDKKLAKNKKLVLAAGSYTESLEIPTKDFLKIMSGVSGNFTQ